MVFKATTMLAPTPVIAVNMLVKHIKAFFQNWLTQVWE